MLEGWKDVKGYHQFVRERLKNTSFEGWDGYVLKEKLRNKTHRSNLEEKNHKSTWIYLMSNARKGILDEIDTQNT
jgi:hypothetical protein